MTSNNTKFIALMAAFTLLLFSPVPVYAGVLDGIAGAFDDDLGPGAGGAWTGSTIYDNGLAAPNNLTGTIDYAVMTAADYATAFPASSYAAGNALVYLYQVNNTGTFSVSAEIVGINNPADTIGQFENVLGEIASSLFGFDIGGNAIWNFTVPFIGTGQSSYILTFSSPNVPELGSSITVNGGTFGVSLVPTPSATPIPEPAGLALVVAASVLALTGRRRRKL